MNKLKTDYPCDFKLWLSIFSPFILPFMQKKLLRKVECHFKNSLIKHYQDFWHLNIVMIYISFQWHLNIHHAS